MFHIPRSALVALVVGAAQVLVLVALRLLPLQLRRHLVGAAEVARLLLLLDLRFLPAAERATQGDILLPAKITLLNRPFLALSVSHLLARKKAGCRKKMAAAMTAPPLTAT